MLRLGSFILFPPHTLAILIKRIYSVNIYSVYQFVGELAQIYQLKAGCMNNLV